MAGRVLFIDEGRLKFDGGTKEFLSGKAMDERFRELSGAAL